MNAPELPDSYEQLRQTTIYLLQQAKRHPVPAKRLHKDIARTVASYRTARLLSLLEDLAASGIVIILGDGTGPEYFWAENLSFLKERLCTLIRSHHTNNPSAPGMTSGDIKKRFSETQTLNAKRNIDARLFALAMTACKNDGLVVEAGHGVRLSCFTPQTKSEDELAELEDNILGYVKDRFCACLDIEELSRICQTDTRTANDAVSRMVKDGRLIRLARKYPVKEYRYLCTSVVEHAKTVLAAELAGKLRLSTSEMRVALGRTRSTTIPLLEYFDDIGFTHRVGDYRERAQMAAMGRSSPGSS